VPNTLIDMGFNSAIQFYIWNRNGSAFGTHTGAGWPTDTGNAQTVVRPYISWIRDRIKLAMEAENGGLNWRVESSRQHYGYGFIIQRLVGGVPDDHEFLFSINGLRDNSSDIPLSRHNNCWGVSVTDGTPAFLAISPTTASFIAMHHNPLGTLSTYSVDANPADTYNVANDFNEPDSNPYSNLNGFMPDRSQSPWVPGWSINQGIFSDSTTYMNTNRWCLLFNHELPFITYYRCQSKAYSIRDFACLGEIIVPRVSSDPWKHGMIATNVFHQYGGNWGTYIYGLHPDGVQWESFPGITPRNPGQHSQFNMENQPRADGTYDRDLYKIWNSNIDKGHTDPNVWVVTAPYGQLWNRLFDADYGTVLSLFESICVPWTDNDPVFPGGYPTNGWFGPRIQDSVP